MPLPRSAAAVVAAGQGGLVTLLQSLLRGTDREAVATPDLARNAVYRGADAELLRLQEEVLALALDVLRMAPASEEEPERE